MNASTTDALQSTRNVAADASFSDYDFGTEVSAADGWETVIPGDEMTRRVYLSDGPPAFFTVRFAPKGDSIVEAYAITDTGNIFGVAA